MTSELLNSFDLQIEKGLQTSYAPYNPNGKWYLKKNTNKIIFNGSEHWSLYDNKYLRSPTVGDIEASYLYCNIGSYIIFSALNVNTDNRVAPRATSSANQFWARFSQFADADAFETFLTTTNMIVYYTSNPRYILLNDTLQSQLTEIYKWVLSYQEQTNISQVNNDLPFVINTITCYDLNKLLTRVEVLESEV
jgi:hypothetical protein